MGEILFKVKIDDWLWALGLGDAAKRSIRPFISRIDSFDLNRAIDGSNLYALRVNQNHPYRDEWPDAALHPAWQKLLGSIPGHACILVSLC
ncbi:hypothetical protein RHMOL_Rhmol03G0095800 [Rhododendron molle]|uniref:Uncharacterized protein n=1 Tax=Rhododendron molle TaxID=49168 RepID=A0ACC0PDL0_RHOML|nr:hypothetical protein RHMOL_Rhmol03G0095800 [Rhododendron molle]